MHWQFTPYLFPLAAVVVVSISLAIFAWRSRPSASILPFVLLMAGIAMWTFGYAMEVASVELSAKIFWAKFQYLGIVATPTAWLILTLQYTGKEKWLTRRCYVLLSIEPLLILFLVWTNEFHHLVWKNIGIETGNSFSVLNVVHGVGFWINVAYSYSLLLIAVLLLSYALIHFSALYRKQIAVLLMGAVVPWIGNMLYIFGFNPFPPIDLTPFTLFISGISAAWAVLRFRFLDIVPIARDILIENMEEGVIVLDMQNRIVDANPAAEKIIERHLAEIIGQPVEKVLSKQKELLKCLQNTDVEDKEICLYKKGKQRYYNIYISPIHDRRGYLAGRLIILRDITKHKKYEEEIKQLNEELQLINKIMRHDILTDLQIIQGSLELYLEEKDGNLLDKAIKRVEKSIQMIHRMRDLEALLASGKELKEYNIREVIEGILKNYHINFNIEGDGVVMADDAIYSVIENIIKNAITHGKTDRIDVKIESKDNICRIHIADYGKGIPDEIKERVFEERFSYGETKGTGLGLYIVRKIIERYGGSIRIEDNEPRGTVVIIELKKK